MTKELFALLMAGTSLVPQISPALGESIVQKPAKDFAACLPDASTSVPWLNLDRCTKLPKGDYPLGRYAESVGLLVLQPAPDIQLSSNEEQDRGS